MPLDLSHPQVMGIINITDDSFYKGSRVGSIPNALQTAEQMLIDGASILDIGGCSTRPGATLVEQKEELLRILPIVEAIAKEFDGVKISIDTFRSEVANQSAQLGATMINDISGGDFDDKMFDTVAQLGLPYVMMHTRGLPAVMAQNTHYNDLCADIIEHLKVRIDKLTALGHKDIIIDPGFGFAKDTGQNFELMRELYTFQDLGRPILVGISRKGMIWKSLNISPEEALNGTTVLNTVALLQGASILRVHDVKQAVEAVKLVNLINNN